MQGRTEESIAAMRETLRIDPNHIPARRALGGLLMKAGDLPGAIAELERTIQQKPNDKKATEWLEMIRGDARLRGLQDNAR
jgi:tetratricopeptide (TPR) repeat protein